VDPARLIAACALLIAVLANPLASASQKEAPGGRVNLVTATFDPVNMGRFTFRDDGGLAFEPNLRMATGFTLAYHREVVPKLIVGVSLGYLHTLVDYSSHPGTFDGDGFDDGVRGYADLLRPAIELGGLWSPSVESIDFGAGVRFGPAVVWFEDLRMVGFFGAVEASATFWFNGWLGLHVSIGLSVDSVWATDASGWAASEIEGAAAYTVFLDVGLGLRARF